MCVQELAVGGKILQRSHMLGPFKVKHLDVTDAALSFSSDMHRYICVAAAFVKQQLFFQRLQRIDFVQAFILHNCIICKLGAHLCFCLGIRIDTPKCNARHFLHGRLFLILIIRELMLPYMRPYIAMA